jgi:small redox-active disulfide protein 2
VRHLTISEAAEALQLSVPTVKRYIYDGKLHSTKLPGGQHRIAESEIERLLEHHRSDASADRSDADALVSAEQRIAVLERWVTELEAEIERLTAGLQVVSRYCARRGTDSDALPTPVSDASGARVAVLGPGCRRCTAMYKLTIRALRSIGRADLVVHRVSDLDEIAEYGPILTPALAVDDQIIVTGRIPSEAALRELLTRHLG